MGKPLAILLNVFVTIGLLWASGSRLILQAHEAAPFARAAAAAPLRLGDGARQLSEADIVKIESILPGGKKPWLLSGDLGAMMVPSITAYLPAATETPEIRRGSMIHLRRAAIASPDSQPWTINANGDYAQVAVAGRSFDQIQGDQDLNRPFSVGGIFDDAELLSIVKFVRANNSGPLKGVSRQGDGLIIASIRTSATGSLRLVIGKQRLGWVILEVATVNS